MPDAACRRTPISPETLPAYLERFLDRYPPSPTYWVAYSGGLDSTVLLHCAAAIVAANPAFSIRAVHIHHGLHHEADAWAAHCQQTCDLLRIPLSVLTVDAARRPRQSPEETARTARYQAIESLVGPGDAVLLAQHRDDQAETVLLQLFRGSGLNGLAAMPAQAEFGHGTLLRPFLELTRADLQAYATLHHLNWVEDSSNADSAFDRNFLRQQVVPLLQSRWPGLSQTLARTARHCAEASELLTAEAQALLNDLLEPNGTAISTDRLAALDLKRQKLALRAWISTAGYRMPNTVVIERILREGLGAGPDRNPRVRWQDAQVCRHRGGLYVLPLLASVDNKTIRDWPPGQDTLKLDGYGELTMIPSNQGGLCRERWERSRVEVRYRQGGERLRLPRRTGSHELKKLFQEVAMPTWIRERIPLVYLDNQLASVGGFWNSSDFAATEAGSPHIRLEWTPPAGLNPIPFNLGSG
jgi:tRNA(Ile)-lysidine synthase